MSETATGFPTDKVNRIGILSTLVDAGLALARGRPRSALLLLGAAALSSRIPGLGVVVSLFLRLYRRMRG